MEVTYRRNLQKSYMCVKEQEEPAAEYELNMLKAEHVPYLLELDVVESDGEKNYLYDISGPYHIFLRSTRTTQSIRRIEAFQRERSFLPRQVSYQA